MSDNSFKKLYIKQFPSREKPGKDQWWNKFKSPILVKEHGAVTSISFNPVSPHDFCVTSMARCQIYSSQDHQVKKTISRFKDVAYSGHIRQDGRLMVAGDGSALVQVFDLSSRAVLRTFQEHNGPVHTTKFAKFNLTNIVSGSDDATVKLWDIPAESSLATWEHEDYVRTVTTSETGIVMSGSYDRTVKLWDSRTRSNVGSFNHDAPVESVLFFPGGNVAVSAGDNYFKVWDIIGNKCLRTVSNHQKTITSLALDPSNSRLLSASLDGHVKIYDVVDYSVLHSSKYPAPILSMALAPDASHLIVGMNTGLLSIKQKSVKSQDLAQEQLEKNVDIRTGSYKYWIRGGDAKPSQGDVVTEVEKKVQLKDYDKLLKSFQYSAALDSVLSKNLPPLVVVSMLEELIYRDGLKIALSGRDDVSLEPVAKFILKYITNPRYSSLLIDVANVILDMYSNVIGQSVIIDEIFSKIKQKIREEIELDVRLHQVIGSLDMIFSSGMA